MTTDMTNTTGKNLRLPIRVLWNWREELKVYRRIGVPILATQLLQMSMGLVDTLMVGRYDSLHLAGVAVGTGSWFSSAFGLIGIVFVLSALVARHNGAGEQDKIPPLVRSTLWLAAGLGIIAICMVYFGFPRAYAFVGVLPETAEIAVSYTIAVASTAPLWAMSAVLRSYSEGLGRTLPIMLVVLGTALINIPLNWMLIYGNLGMPELGGVGAGVATATVNALSFVAMVAYCYWAPFLKDVRITDKFSWPRLDHVLTILKLGIPVGATLMIEISMFGGASVLAARLPPTITSGHLIALQIASMAFMIPLAIGMTTTVRVGHYLGLKSPVVAGKVSRLALILSMLAAGFNSSVMLALGDILIRPFTTDAAVIVVGTGLLLYAAIFQFWDALQGVAVGALRGYTDTLVPSIVVAISYWGIGIPLGWMLAFEPEMVADVVSSLGASGWMTREFGIEGLWVAMNISLLLVAVALIWRLRIVSERTIMTTKGVTPKVLQRSKRWRMALSRTSR